MVKAYHSDLAETSAEVAARDYNKARDVFRRRCAVRGFRLGLICMTLWDQPKAAELKKCCDFINMVHG